MTQAAQLLEKAEKALRQIYCDLIVAASDFTAIYETVMELAVLGKAIRVRIQKELEEAKGKRRDAGGRRYEWGESTGRKLLTYKTA
jgi:hypothetical protein